MPNLTLKLPPSVERAVVGYPHSRQAAVDVAVKALKAPASDWPVKTGRSKKAWRRTGKGGRAVIRNNTPYAYIIEEHGKPGQKTVNRARTRMLKAANAEKF